MPDGRVRAFVDIADAPDLQLGDKDNNLRKVQQFLLRFGYLSEEAYEGGVLDPPTSSALSLYQERSSLKVTGSLDEETRNSMTTARCAMPDLIDGVAFRARCSWDRVRLTYAFGPGTNDTAGASEFDAVRTAFATWAAASPLRFTEVNATDNPDILIDWRDANDPDLSMVGGTLAHADWPPNCGVVTNQLPKPVHFDDSEHVWAIGAAADAYDVETVALHEIGHIIGLEHSTVNGAVMVASVSDNFTLRVLQPDDLAGVHQLYSPPCSVAFQANTGNLWTLDPDLNEVDRGLGMMADTSPSITPVGSGNFYAVAFQANTGNLWTLDPGPGAVDRGLGMRTGTSPSVTLRV